MKRILQTLFAGLIILNLSNCKKDENSGPLPLAKFELEKTSISVEEGKTDTVAIKNGGGNYSVSPNSAFAEILFEGEKIVVKALKPGEVVFTIRSDSRQATLEVKVTAKPVQPLEGEAGLYDESGKNMMKAKYKARKADLIWLSDDIKSPYAKYLMMHAVSDKLKPGEKADIGIKSRGIPELEGKTSVSAILELRNGNMAQLKIEGGLRLLCPVKN